MGATHLAGRLHRLLAPADNAGGADRHERRPDVQGLRAIAVLLVVLFHAGLDVPGGFTGVDVFFVISGFVIAQTLLRELERSGTISIRGFYARRVRRLLPALAVMLVVIAALGIVASPIGAQRTGGLTGIWSALFAANAYVYHLPTGYFDVSSAFNPLLHTWTLAVEEQFYVVFPTLLLLSWRLGRRRRGHGGSGGRRLPIVTVGIVTAVSFLLCLDLARDRPLGGVGSHSLAFYSSPTRAWEFGVGALLALGSQQAGRLPRAAAQLLALAGVAAIVAGAFGIHDAARFPDLSALLPVGGALLVIAAGCGGRTVVGDLLSTRPVVWLGNLSYSWYLWHWPLIVFAKALWPGSGWSAPLAAAVALIPSTLSLGLIENPIRFSRRITGRRVVALAASCILLPIGASAGLIAVRHALDSAGSVQAWQRTQQLHLDKVRGCSTATPGGQRGDRCTWKAAGSHGTAVLLGDSNAGHLTEPFIVAAQGAGLDASVVTFGACPFVPLRVLGSNAPTAACSAFTTGTLAWLLQAKPELVVIAARTDGYVEGAAIGLAPLGSGPTARTTRGKAALWQSSLTSLLRQLNQAGIPAIVVHPVPALAFEPTGCAMLRVLRNDCGATESRARADRRRALVVGIENAAVASAPAAWALDPIGTVCDAVRCSSNRAGLALYRDGFHLSVAGSLTLADQLASAVSVHARV